jgi:hypothetical protein
VDPLAPAPVTSKDWQLPLQQSEFSAQVNLRAAQVGGGTTAEVELEDEVVTVARGGIHTPTSTPPVNVRAHVRLQQVRPDEQLAPLAAHVGAAVVVVEVDEAV